MPIEVLSAEPSRLGECPIWCDRTRRLWWVDVLTPVLWSHDPATGTSRRHEFKGRRLGSIALRESGGLILACDDGIYGYDPDTGRQDFLVDPEPGLAGHRKNDGRADPLGNFWVGTLEEAAYATVGRLYCVHRDLSVTTEADRISIPNALAFDGERGRMYFADTRAYRIWVYEQQPSGSVSNPRTFAQTTPPARPDGSCVDAEGYLWNAEYAGGRIVRFAPSGEVADAITLPVSYPTCCCFGGEGLDRLFVTSALEPLSDEQRVAEPLAGHVFVLDPGVRGRPESRVAF